MPLVSYMYRTDFSDLLKNIIMLVIFQICF